MLRIHLKFDVCAGGCEPEGNGEGWEGELWEVQAALLTGRHHRLPYYQVPADLSYHWIIEHLLTVVVDDGKSL
jgi:hypothetical protein